MRALPRRTFFALALAFAAPAYAAAPLTSVDVALGDVSINKIPFLIAADAGIYTKYGLEVHQFITKGAADHIAESGVHVPPELVKSDPNAPISSGGGSPTIYGMVNNPKAVQRVIVSTTEAIVRDHIVAVPSIHTLADLKGKRLGYTGTATVTHYNVMAFVTKMGWDPMKDVTLIPRVDTLDALKQGKADAFTSSAMTTALAPAAGMNVVADLSTYNIPLAGSGVMMRKDWLAANRDTAMRFVKATVEATALMKKDRKTFDAALAKWFNVKDKATLDHLFASVQGIPVKPYPAVEGIKLMMAMYDSPAMRMHKTEDFYDSSFIAELDKSGFLNQVNK